ncbi:hypothetical protein [Pseudomonas sp. NFACC39-1]|uniref:hypothetical protein n=1 Tax=Pseudomonas sp. NFACC39-1 TaxID=1566195 RepID=UPI000B890762|nr:hypothetical protein [Pseudomonas sp. NFACC39-1]
MSSLLSRLPGKQIVDEVAVRHAMPIYRVRRYGAGSLVGGIIVSSNKIHKKLYVLIMSKRKIYQLS